LIGLWHSLCGNAYFYPHRRRYAGGRQHDEGADAEELKSWWQERLPGQIPERVVIAEELDGNVIQLEGQDLVVVEVGHTDTTRRSCMCQRLDWLSPEMPRTTAFINCCPKPTRRSDVSGLPRSIKSSRWSRAVIAGHKWPGSEDSPRIIEETRQYIRDFDGLVEKNKTARQLYDQMLELHPLRMNVNPLWTSALALKA